MAAQFATDSGDNPLWDYALTVYAKTGVKECLLNLQNEQGMDVLLLLADGWLQQQHRGWPASGIPETYLHWRDDMIVPLRALRCRLQKEAEPLRSQLLSAELSAEKEGLRRLYMALPESDGKGAELLSMTAVFIRDNGQKKEAIRPLLQQLSRLMSA